MSGQASGSSCKAKLFLAAGEFANEPTAGPDYTQASHQHLLHAHNVLYGEVFMIAVLKVEDFHQS